MFSIRRLQKPFAILAAVLFVSLSAQHSFGEDSRKSLMERQSATNSPVKLGFVILYVKDQASSARFYSRVLAQKPTLDVPGMTEFTLENGFKFGLMSEKGIAGLLGPALPDPSKGSGIPRAEIYIKVADPQAYHQRALDSGAREISPLQPRPWGDRVAYSIDPDGHVLAFAGD